MFLTYICDIIQSVLIRGTHGDVSNGKTCEEWSWIQHNIAKSEEQQPTVVQEDLCPLLQSTITLLQSKFYKLIKTYLMYISLFLWGDACSLP
jgi:hypothetical protein